MRMNKKNIVLSLLSFLWLISSADHAIGQVNLADAKEKAVKRWAIIASKDDESQKLADLLFAELANESNLKLVERDELAKISNEQELGNLSEAGNSKERFNLLNLIKADRLITLSVHSLAKLTSVRMVISESSQGARFKSNTFPFLKMNPQR